MRYFFTWLQRLKISNRMKVFIAFVKKEFYHIFRDRRTLLVLFGMPLAQLLLFGYAITTEVSNARMVVFNQSPGQFSNQLIEEMYSSDFLASFCRWYAIWSLDNSSSFKKRL